MQKALISALMLTLTLPGCALFAGGPNIATANVAGCSSLIDPEWAKGVEGDDPPFDDPTIGGWEKFADRQTGHLGTANDRTKAVIGIVGRCEARDRDALKKAKGGALRRIFGDNDPRWMGVHLDPKRYAPS